MTYLVSAFWFVMLARIINKIPHGDKRAVLTYRFVPELRFWFDPELYFDCNISL